MPKPEKTTVNFDPGLRNELQRVGARGRPAAWQFDPAHHWSGVRAAPAAAAAIAGGVMRLLMPNAAAKLDRTRSDLRGVQTRLDRLADDRAAAVAGDGDIEAVRKIDVEIEAARGQIVAYGERITSLEARVAVEEQTRREAEHRGGDRALQQDAGADRRRGRRR